MLVQDLLLMMQYLYDPVEVFLSLDGLLVHAAELTKRHILSKYFIERAGLQYWGFNCHGLRIVQCWTLITGADFLELYLVSVRDSLRDIFCGIPSQFGRVHSPRSEDHTRPRITSYSLTTNEDSPVLCHRIAIIENPFRLYCMYVMARSTSPSKNPTRL